MLKKLLSLVVLVSSTIFSQHTVKGYISPNLKSDWVILYRIEGTQQVFINNTTIKKDSLNIGGNLQAVGSFQFKLPANAKPGSYRATYRLEEAGFIDFYYNKENIEFIFNPEYAQQSVAFTKSKENNFYKNYLAEITVAQEKIDSIQIAYIQDNSLKLDSEYQQAVTKFNAVQKKFENESKNMYVYDFIKASPRINPPKMVTTGLAYLNQIKNTFFSKLNFKNTRLKNSAFLTNRILDYIFYINFAEDSEQQQILFKSSIDTVLAKLDNLTYKRDIIEFLISQFESSKNIEIIDYLFAKHYDKLPKNLINQKFKEEKKALFTATIGRIAPDFTWSENGKSYKLSTLNDAQKYVLVFWSTSCSHCLREIPQLHELMKNKTEYKVIAFALENDAFVWETYSKTNLPGWHNVLGLNKWENKTARTYQINATPTYFILDSSKKIIAKPYEFKDVKIYLEN